MYLCLCYWLLYTALIWSATNFSFTALLDGICPTLNSRIQALKQSTYKAEYLFEDCNFGAITGARKIKCLEGYKLINMQ